MFELFAFLLFAQQDPFVADADTKYSPHNTPRIPKFGRATLIASRCMKTRR